MRVQHNIPAMNSYRNFNKNASGLNKNLEKLSSGYKINRAGDDAAGLAISEKMRAQITGLEVANKNAKDGISVVQTAEGALTEVHDMLNRMYNLAEQSANGTYQLSERQKLQDEIDQLSDEIDRIADSTNFNGLKLLDGTMKTRDAGSERINLTGMDRVLKSVIEDGEKPYDVAGVKTVTDKYNEDAVKAKFSVDLSNFDFKTKITGAKASANGTFAMSDVSLQIGDLKLYTKAFSSVASQGGIAVKISNGSAQKINSASIATALFSYSKIRFGATTNATSVTVTLNNVEWKMTLSSAKLTFEQIGKPETEEEARANFDVKITLGEAVEANASMSLEANNPAMVKFLTGSSLYAGTNVETVGIPEGSTRTANTIIQITENDIKDGATMKLGNGSDAKKLIFKVGNDSKVVAGSGQELIDLKSMDPDKIDLGKALGKIYEKVSSFTYKYSYRTASGAKATATATFNVGVSDGTQGFPAGLAIRRVDTLQPGSQSGQKPAYFTDITKFDNLFAMKYDQDITAQTGLTLQIGEDAEEWNQLVVSIDDMHAEALGLGDLDITTAEKANDAMQSIMAAIDKVSTTRGTLGALQNRLDHTINSLSVSRENLQDAESTIRDTDVAEEMMAYTKNSILNQAAQAMLAQANQLPQGVLQLLG